MSIRPVERFLGGEGKRNRHNAALYTAMLNKAWGTCEVIVGHHINFEFDSNLDTEDEIPSADTLLFNHQVMMSVFDNPYEVMREIAAMSPYEREEHLVSLWNQKYPEEPVTLPPKT